MPWGGATEQRGGAKDSAVGPLGWPMPCSLSSLFAMNCRARAEGLARRLNLRMSGVGGDGLVEQTSLVRSRVEERYCSMECRHPSLDEPYLDPSTEAGLRPIHVVTSEPIMHISLPPVKKPLSSGNPSEPVKTSEPDSDMYYDFDIASPNEVTEAVEEKDTEGAVEGAEYDPILNGEMNGERPESGCATSVTSPLMFSDVGGDEDADDRMGDFGIEDQPAPDEEVPYSPLHASSIGYFEGMDTPIGSASPLLKSNCDRYQNDFCNVYNWQCTAACDPELGDMYQHTDSSQRAPFSSEGGGTCKCQGADQVPVLSETRCLRHSASLLVPIFDFECDDTSTSCLTSDTESVDSICEEDVSADGTHSDTSEGKLCEDCEKVIHSEALPIPQVRQTPCSSQAETASNKWVPFCLSPESIDNSIWKPLEARGEICLQSTMSIFGSTYPIVDCSVTPFYDANCVMNGYETKLGSLEGKNCQTGDRHSTNADQCGLDIFDSALFNMKIKSQNSIVNGEVNSTFDTVNISLAENTDFVEPENVKNDNGVNLCKQQTEPLLNISEVTLVGCENGDVVSTSDVFHWPGRISNDAWIVNSWEATSNRDLSIEGGYVGSPPAVMPNAATWSCVDVDKIDMGIGIGQEIQNAMGNIFGRNGEVLTPAEEVCDEVDPMVKCVVLCPIDPNDPYVMEKGKEEGENVNHCDGETHQNSQRDDNKSVETHEDCEAVISEHYADRDDVHCSHIHSDKCQNESINECEGVGLAESEEENQSMFDTERTEKNDKSEDDTHENFKVENCETNNAENKTEGMDDSTSGNTLDSCEEVSLPNQSEGNIENHNEIDVGECTDQDPDEDTEDKSTEDEVEEDAIVTGKFRNLRGYTERVRLLSDSEDSAAQSTVVIHIDDSALPDAHERVKAATHQVCSDALASQLSQLDVDASSNDGDVSPHRDSSEEPEDETDESSERSEAFRKRIKRSSSLKCGKTPPGTPGRKKIVRFADVLGLDLEAVRTYLDGIPTVPQSAFSDLDPQAAANPNVIPGGETAASANSSATTVSTNLPLPRRILTPLFQQPGSLPDFLTRVRDNKVALENVEVGADLSVRGFVRVLNIDFHKSVYIRYTFDQWRNWHEATATYNPGSCDGFSDRFSFLLWGSFLQNNGALSFAVRYHTAGQQFWDNNRGTDYVLQCYTTGVASADRRGSAPTSNRVQNAANVEHHLAAAAAPPLAFAPYQPFSDLSLGIGPIDPWATRFF